VNAQPGDSQVRRGEVLWLTQRSARRREYALRQDEQVIGWLRFASGRRSVAMAAGDETGSLALIASSGRVDVRGGQDTAATLATVEGDPGGTAVIRSVHGRPLRWQRIGPPRRWTIAAGTATLLSFTAVHGLATSSVRITAQHDLPKQTAVLLCLVGGFLALRELQTDIDASAAVGGIVASAGG
jgi:hypothetical protein